MDPDRAANYAILKAWVAHERFEEYQLENWWSVGAGKIDRAKANHSAFKMRRAGHKVVRQYPKTPLF